MKAAILGTADTGLLSSPLAISDLGDGDILRNVIVGGSAERELAFEELVRRHGALVYGVCRRRMRDKSLADDAAQAVFMILARKASALRGTGSLSGWLYRTAVQVCSSMLRDQRTRIRHEKAAAKLPDDGLDPEVMAAVRRSIDEGLLHLKPSEREALLLCYFEEVPQEAAAKRMGISYAAYRQRLSRALERLRQHFGMRGKVLSEGALGAAVVSLSRADAAESLTLHANWTACSLGMAPASAGVVKTVNGVLRSMAIKTGSVALFVAAFLSIGIATALIAADRSEPPKIPPPEAVANTPLPGKPQSMHQVLEDIKGIGTPVMSRDGRWLAVREEGDKLALIDLEQAQQNPKAEPARYDLARLAKSSAWDNVGVGVVAAFSPDSQRMIFCGKENLMILALPAKEPPVPMVNENGEKLGTEYVPALSAKYASPVVPPVGQRVDVWPLYQVPKVVPPPPGPGQSSPALRELLFHVPDAKGKLVKGPLVVLGSVQWIGPVNEVAVTLANGDAAVIRAATGKAVRTFSKAAFEKDVGKPLESLSIISGGAEGKAIVEAARLYPPEMRDMIGTYVPSGDEAPERGRNPGSAEPGPAMPRYIYLCEGDKRTRIFKASVARWLDTLWVLPSQKLDKYLYFQVANDGHSGHGVPHVWLGQLDATGKRTEKDLGNPFAKTVDAPQFNLLSLEADASRAIVLMRAQRPKTVPNKVDDATRKKIEDGLKNGEIRAVHRDGREALVQMLGGHFIFQKYERAGGATDRDGNVTMTFYTWQVWELNGKEGSVKAISPEYGEAIGELEGTVGIGGAARAGWNATGSAYHAATGLLALPLSGVKRGQRGADEESRGLMLIRTK
ncbi:MAG TPA: sigma-70 family RNA polymerase sigma factor [Planctomycetota bacterium]|nr:sigma-70 family RNA polymerase sigma factor [Planctomycetota bacterium]